MSKQQTDIVAQVYAIGDALLDAFPVPLCNDMRNNLRLVAMQLEAATSSDIDEAKAAELAASFGVAALTELDPAVQAKLVDAARAQRRIEEKPVEAEAAVAEAVSIK